MDERVRNGSFAGALAFVVLAVLGVVSPEIMGKLPTGFEAALTTIFSTFIAWVIPRTKGKAAT